MRFLRDVGRRRASGTTAGSGNLGGGENIVRKKVYSLYQTRKSERFLKEGACVF